MPTLTIDLPEAAYRAALAFDKAERVRLITATFIAAEAILPDDESSDDPELSEDDYAAIGRGLESMKAGHTTPGSIVFDRIRAKYGLRKGDSPV